MNIWCTNYIPGCLHGTSCRHFVGHDQHDSQFGVSGRNITAQYYCALGVCNRTRNKWLNHWVEYNELECNDVAYIEVVYNEVVYNEVEYNEFVVYV